MDDQYMPGFGNDFSTEALEGALPIGQNSPQRCPHDLIAEQLSGTAFTVSKPFNQRSWLYRLRPSVTHSPFEPTSLPNFQSMGAGDFEVTPNQLRWQPLPAIDGDFLDGIYTMAANEGSSVHLYRCNRSMGTRVFYSSDGELLIVPQEGKLAITTEMGRMTIEPQEIAVIPRGLKFKVDLPDGAAAGYMLENNGALLRLPGLGPIGANGLANPRDFLTPVAWYEDQVKEHTIVTKFAGKFFAATQPTSPFDVAAWHGNLAPYKYDLRRFNTINTVSFDHPDPSIFTVLTSPTDSAGVANIDFVIFPPRWVVGEHTFRPPYFHRNVMSEYMGLIHGAYDAKGTKGGAGFIPGGSSLHNCMTPHGPDKETFDKASTVEQKPFYQGDTMAFMFESSKIYVPTQNALKAEFKDQHYNDGWQNIAVENIDR